MEAHTVGNSIPRVIITTRKSTLKHIAFGCVVRSEHRIDTLNAISIGEEYLNIFMTERFIEKTVFLGGPNKEVQKEPQEVLYKKAALKNSTIFTGKHLCWSLFSPTLEYLRLK